MMISRIKNYQYLHLTAFMGLAGFMSLDVYLDNLQDLFLPTLFLIFILYLTSYLVYQIMGEINPIFNLAIFMVIIGWLIILRIEPELALRHLLWTALGCFLLIISLKFLFIFPSDLIVRYRYFWLILTLLLLFLPLIWGVRVGGAKSWLELNGFRFQPSEAAKISYLIFLACWFKERLWVSWKNAKPLWLGTGFSMGLLVLQKDLGTALIFYLSFLLILYLATGKLYPSFLGLTFLVVGAFIAYYFFPHVQIRFETWLNPWQEPESSGYQILQSLFALASGGTLGVGLGGGIPDVIPEAHTDFVFTVIGEQLGLLGTTGIALLYLFFAFFSLKKSQHIPTAGRRVLAAGFTLVIVVQAFIIMGGVTKLIPLTGLPLPFISYGGSSIVSSFIMIALIIWSSREKEFVPFSTRRYLINVNNFIGLLFLLLFINLFYWQVIKAQDLINHNMNPRKNLVENYTIRGTICASDGSVLAGNIGNSRERYYPLGEAGVHITGYSSQEYEKAGLENSLNFLLLADTEGKPDFISKDKQGFNIYTTINAKLQKLAWELHQEKTGATVVMDVKTGDILALVSSPTYNPNKLNENWESYQEDRRAPFLNRATQGLYPPGSVFKLISGVTLLKLKPETFHSSLALEQHLNIEGYRISDLIYRSNLNFQEALGYSSNLFFIKHFLDISWEEIEEEITKSFLFKEDFSIPGFTVAQAQLGEISDSLDKAFSIIGQGKVLVTPMHMAIWCSAIANGGLILQPKIIDKVIDTQGFIIHKENPIVLGIACSEKEAQQVLKGMEFSVEAGTATQAKSKDLRIGGKTGTAENDNGDPHAWFIGVAPVEDPRFLAVTIVENGGRGGEISAPIAKALLEAAFE